MDKYAVIVAGGSGLRMGASMPKQFLPLRGRPLLWYSLTAFLTAYDDLQIILVLPPTFMEMGAAVANATAAPGRIQLTTGGDTRFHSVKNGLKLINTESVVFVHDGVRCLITPALVHKCYNATVEKGNAIPAVTAMDTIRVVTADGSAPLDRSKVRIIQTPQTFLSATIKAAYEQEHTASFTDEATVAEKMGVHINLVEGESTNIKITTPFDLLLAEKILEQRASNPGNAPAV